MNKFYTLIAAFCLLARSGYGQFIENDFLVGMYCFDLANNNYTYRGMDGVEPFDYMYFQTLVDDGFNLAYIDYPNTPTTGVFYPQTIGLGFLDNARHANIKLVLAHSGYSSSSYMSTWTAYNSSNVATGLSHYGFHPALLGYIFADEPTAAVFGSNVTPASLQAKAYNPWNRSFVNLLPAPGNGDYNRWMIWRDCPDTGGGGGCLDPNPTSSWTAEDVYTLYLQTIMGDSSAIDFFTVDPYPISWSSRNFFITLSCARKVSRQYGKSFGLVDLPYKLWTSSCDPDYGKPKSSFKEFSLPIFASLAYGSKGIVYYPRHHKNLPSIVSWDNGLNATLRSEVVALLKSLRLHHDVLNLIDITDVFHYSNQMSVPLCDTPPGEVDVISSTELWSEFLSSDLRTTLFRSSRLGTAPIEACSGNPEDLYPLMISFGNTYQTNSQYMWVMNKSMDTVLEIKLNFKNAFHIVDVLNDRISTTSSTTHYISLEPGEGKLLKIHNNNSTLPCVAAHTITTSYGVMNVDNFGCTPDYTEKSWIHHGDLYTSRMTMGRNAAVSHGNFIYGLSEFSTNSCGSGKMGMIDGVEEEEITACYPNPSTDIVNVSVELPEGRAATATIYSIEGLKVAERRVDENLMSISTRNLRPGLYFVVVESDGKVLHKCKVIVQ